MKRTALFALVVGLLWPTTLQSQDASDVLEAAAVALGTKDLNSIQISGRGSDYIFGQPYDGHSPWPRFGVPKYTLTIDFTIPAMVDHRTRVQVQNPPLGGGTQPIVGVREQIWSLSGPYAWNTQEQNTTLAGSERDQRTAVEGRLAQIRLTPHGFIKAAIAADATVETQIVHGAKKTIVSFTPADGPSLEGVLNDQYFVERIETWLDNSILGDTLFEAIFSNYKEFNGVKFPARIRQREGGYPILDITITNVQPNITTLIDVPDNIKNAESPAPEAIQPEKLSNGIWIIPGGAKSIAVELSDYIVVIEAPANEARSIAVIDAIKNIIPNKPIRYVINTHLHFDHAGGLRTYAAEGATIITHKDNVPYYKQVWSNPRTINPDRLIQSGLTPVFEGLIGNRTLGDSSRTLVIYHYAGNMHNAGMLMVFLPKEKILIEADSFSPRPNQTPRAIPNLMHFHTAVEQLRLDVELIVPIHGQLATLNDVQKTIQEHKDLQLWMGDIPVN